MKYPQMIEIEPTKEMIKQAQSLGQGKLLIVYRDHTAIRMETEDGDNPYVWRCDRWRVMRRPRRLRYVHKAMYT